jgi:hypothetical protein
MPFEGQKYSLYCLRLAVNYFVYFVWFDLKAKFTKYFPWSSAVTVQGVPICILLLDIVSAGVVMQVDELVIVRLDYLCS